MKYARLLLDNQILANKELSIFIFKDILFALPSDTTIINFLPAHNTIAGKDTMMVESSSFIDTTNGVYPEIIVHLKTVGNSKYFDCLDMSAALVGYTASPPPIPVPSCSCGTCWGCMNSGVSSNARGISPGSSNYAVPTIKFTPPIPGNYSLAGSNTAGFTQGCNPQYKNYLGLNESYEYCVKCNKKKEHHG